MIKCTLGKKWTKDYFNTIFQLWVLLQYSLNFTSSEHFNWLINRKKKNKT